MLTSVGTPVRGQTVAYLYAVYMSYDINSGLVDERGRAYYSFSCAVKDNYRFG